MIALRDHAEGVVVPVRAQPGARKNGVLGEQAGALKIAVTAPADEGRANQALTETIRDLLNLKRSQVEMLNGAKSRNKAFLIRGVTKSWLQEQLGKIQGSV